MGAQMIKYPLARQEHFCQHWPIFYVLPRGKTRKKGFKRTYISKKNEEEREVIIRFFEELGIGDQDLFLAILAIAFVQKRGNNLTPKSQNNQNLRLELNVGGKYENENTLSINTSFFELNNELVRPQSGRANQILEESLERLSGVSFIIKTPTFSASSNLLSYFICKKTERLKIAINPKNAKVLFGDQKKGFILHNRGERLALKGDPARALHAVLVGLVNQKKSKTFLLETLIYRIYHVNWQDANKDQRKNLKRSLLKASKELNKLKEWQIIDHKNNTFTIKRGVA